jgi:hypothetical protein
MEIGTMDSPSSVYAAILPQLENGLSRFSVSDEHWPWWSWSLRVNGYLCATFGRVSVHYPQFRAPLREEYRPPIILGLKVTK